MAPSKFSNKKLSFLGVIRSEFLKYRTLLTSWIMVIVTLLVMVGLAALAAYSLNFSLSFINDVPPEMGEMDPSSFGSVESLRNSAAALGGAGLDMANMLIASLAVVFIASEYSTRSIQTTLTVVPKRSMAYLGKFVVISVVSFVLGFVSAVISFYVGQLILDDQLKVDVNSGILLNWLAVAAYFMFMAWMGFGLGALIRNNAGAIVTAVALIFVSFIVFMTLPWDWAKDFNDYLPLIIGRTFITYGLADDAEIGYAKAGLVLAAWGAIPALLGYLRFTLTDSK